MSRGSVPRATGASSLTLASLLPLVSLFDDINDAIIITDPSYRIIYWNTGAYDLYGWSTDEVHGHLINEVIPIERWLDGPHHGMRMSLRTNGTWVGRVMQRHRDGSLLSIESSMHLVPTLAPGWIITINRVVAEPVLFARTDTASVLLTSLLSTAPVGIAFVDRQLRYVCLNNALATMNGLPVESHIGRPMLEVLPNLPEQVIEYLYHVFDTGETITDAEITVGHADSMARDQRHFVASYYPVCDRRGSIVAVGTMVGEITARKRLEAQLLHAQKVEAVGHLAGGIAHDFNNLLTAISGYVTLALDAIPTESSASADLREIQRSTQRASDLTSQLLAFTRRKTETPSVIDLNQHILGIERLLRRLLGEDVALDIRLAEHFDAIRIDASQLEQVIVNLAVNARDAMPGGGRLTIETAQVYLDPRHAHGRMGVKAGHYVLLSISDTGLGIDPEIQQHMFEPFFTTKPPGKGTGLGLSICYRIVKQYGGNIWKRE